MVRFLEFPETFQGSFRTICLSFQVSEVLVKWGVPIVISLLTGHDWDHDGAEERTVFIFILLWLIWNCALCPLESFCVSSSQTLLFSRRTLQEIRNGSLALMDISGSERICACLRMYVRFIDGTHMWVECCWFSLYSEGFLQILTENPSFPPSTKPNIFQIPIFQDWELAWKTCNYMKLSPYSIWLKPKCPCPKLLEILAQIKSKPSKLINNFCFDAWVFLVSVDLPIHLLILVIHFFLSWIKICKIYWLSLSFSALNFSCNNVNNKHV